MDVDWEQYFRLPFFLGRTKTLSPLYLWHRWCHVILNLGVFESFIEKQTQALFSGMIISTGSQREQEIAGVRCCCERLIKSVLET
jgi:hypothetical protein